MKTHVPLVSYRKRKPLPVKREITVFAKHPEKALAGPKGGRAAGLFRDVYASGRTGGVMLRLSFLRGAGEFL